MQSRSVVSVVTSESELRKEGSWKRSEQVWARQKEVLSELATVPTIVSGEISMGGARGEGTAAPD